jgi:hypothetical protein
MRFAELVYNNGAVSTTSLAIYILGMLLELSLVYRLFVSGVWRRFPYFFAYVIFVVVQSAALYIVFRWARTLYVPWYLNSGMINLWARFLVVWEIFRHTFPERSSLRRMISGGSMAIALLVGTLLAAMSWGIQSYGTSHSVYRALDRSFGFAQAVLVLAILIVARYYQIQLGRNVWGLAVAFGMYSSMSTINSAFVDVFHFFFPYWALLGPLSLVVMLTMWIWSAWSYYPNPVAVGSGGIAAQANDLREWADGWGQTISSVRKATNP